MIFYLSIALTVVANVLYHVFQKLTPTAINPMLALAVTYATATLVCLAFIPLYPTSLSIGESVRNLNWASIALGIAIVGLELGFLLAYRAGWNISLGAVVSNVTVALLLVPIGLGFFREQLTGVNLLGTGLCIVGLIMLNQR